MNIVGLGVEDLIEKPVEGRRGPATVSASKFAIRHWGKALGRRKGAMTWSQENCPIDGHRLTREGWGWRFRKVLRLAPFFRQLFRALYPALFRSRKRAFLIASVTARTRHKVFPMVFQLHREALLIHFIHFIGLLAARPGGFPPGSPPLFVGRFSPWFQLYGETLLIHLPSPRLRRASGADIGGLLFSTTLLGARRLKAWVYNHHSP